MERLAEVDAVVLDKTGTLTSGGMTIARMSVLTARSVKTKALTAAAALERGSDHPIATLFQPFESGAIQASEIFETDGGITGILGGQRWRIGRYDFVAAIASKQPAPAQGVGVYIGNESGLVAVVEVGEDVRPRHTRRSNGFGNSGSRPSLPAVIVRPRWTRPVPLRIGAPRLALLE